MKKKFLLTACLLFGLCQLLPAQQRKIYSVAFYNLENLFDTKDDPKVQDEDFLPDGRYHWTEERYRSKLKNMAKVLADLATAKTPEGPAFIGVAEVENAGVLDDLVSEPALSNRRLKYVHYDSPDERGIDCALLYNPALFSVQNSRYVLSRDSKGRVNETRGFLVVEGMLADEKVVIIVNHWPSRGGSEDALRVEAARQVREICDSILREDNDAKMIVMGDLNDDPWNNSLQVMRGRKWKNRVKKKEFYNPWWETLQDKKIGTLKYKDGWNLFDQILVSYELIADKKGLRYSDSEVFKRDYLIQQDTQYKGSPLRTFGGRRWLNGYSDHLPTIVYLTK